MLSTSSLIVGFVPSSVIIRVSGPKQPSGSASAEMITFSYLDLLASQDGPIPHPILLAISQISEFLIASFTVLFVIFRILPLSGRTACNSLLRVYMYGPLAESPSTINNSVFWRFLEVHSTSLETTDRLLILFSSSELTLIKELISFLESKLF